ncbi:hypothetical protein RJ640_009810 [Escallonia rubra]|uniref:Uncharacterized protein n=1 Tax=Escallonia rubra TaxID=112253 RepID=A0AA88RBF7_9ASTE|nr:hypothetical protein RJ640_009810 [Escallonia rubra]
MAWMEYELSGKGVWNHEHCFGVIVVASTFLTARMTIAAALASKPVVGSSINITDGLATSSTAILVKLKCILGIELMKAPPFQSSNEKDASDIHHFGNGAKPLVLSWLTGHEYTLMQIWSTLSTTNAGKSRRSIWDTKNQEAGH